MSKVICIAIAMIFTIGAGLAQAKAPQDQIDRLGKDLTPIGAERAGNADGTIPEWNEKGLPIPEGWDWQQRRPDPYADEKPLFTITKDNYKQHADLLTEGQMALLERYEGYTMEIYPSHRDCTYPDWVYERSKKNAGRSTVDENDVYITDGWGPFLFPLPNTGVEIMWNHILGHIGEGRIGYNAIIVPTKSGSFTTVHERDRFWPLFGDKNIDTIEEANGIATFFLLEKLEPARLAGEVVLVHEMVNEKRRAWTYNPGQRRVRRAPTVAYDNPIVATESLMTNDQGRLFNGEPDRFDFKLIGKTEKYVPYNRFALDISDLSYKEIYGAKYPRRDLMRYERHRVWVVEATVREGKRHLFSKRIFYTDEDTWNVVLEDIYDKRGELWRTMEQWPKLVWEVPTCAADGSLSYDLIAGRYVADRQKTHEPPTNWLAVDVLEASMFTPDALRRMGRR